MLVSLCKLSEALNEGWSSVRVFILIEIRDVFKNRSFCYYLLFPPAIRVKSLFQILDIETEKLSFAYFKLLFFLRSLIDVDWFVA